MEKLRELSEHRRLLALLSVPAALAVATLAGVWWFLPQPATRTSTANQLPALAAPSPGFEVQVSGAVLHPGIYFLPPGSRGWTAVQMAGGLAPNANPNQLPNLAQKLKDGSVIKVPALTSRASVPASEKVNLNAATAGQLAAVPGFTSQFAQAVVQYREQSGGFTSLTQLRSVLGMDPAAFAEAKPYLAL
ncbi:MAG: ComEA family DNA-binding protein [Candidatus Dormibacteraeota bacterium]|nr:ComEA family DNA-binding protein [Candidatus Dormibacteraeota bacterium]